MKVSQKTGTKLERVQTHVDRVARFATGLAGGGVNERDYPRLITYTQVLLAELKSRAK